MKNIQQVELYCRNMLGYCWTDEGASRIIRMLAAMLTKARSAYEQEHGCDMLSFRSAAVMSTRNATAKLQNIRNEKKYLSIRQLTSTVKLFALAILKQTSGMNIRAFLPGARTTGMCFDSMAYLSMCSWRDSKNQQASPQWASSLGKEENEYQRRSMYQELAGIFGWKES